MKPVNFVNVKARHVPVSLTELISIGSHQKTRRICVKMVTSGTLIRDLAW